MNLTIIGVPYDLDQVDVAKGRAPVTLLALGLAEKLAACGAQVETEILDVVLPDGSVEQRLGVIFQVLAKAVANVRSAHRLPLVLGGDCLTALGTLAGLGNAGDTSIAWIDAHGDFNTPQSTVSNYLGGMPLACAVGRGLENIRTTIGLEPLHEHNVVLAGVRDLDEAEAQLLQHSEITLLSSMDVNQREGNLDGALALLGKTSQLYLHIDIDVLNNHDAPGVDYPAPAGLTPNILQHMLGQIARLPNLAAVALTAVNPEKDIENRTGLAAIAAIEEVVCAL